MDMLSFTLMIVDAALKASERYTPWIKEYEWQLMAIRGANAYYVDMTPCYPTFYGKYQPDGQPWDWGYGCLNDPNT